MLILKRKNKVGRHRITTPWFTSLNIRNFRLLCFLVVGFCALFFISQQLRPTAVYKEQTNRAKNPTTPLFPAKKKWCSHSLTIVFCEKATLCKHFTALCIALVCSCGEAWREIAMQEHYHRHTLFSYKSLAFLQDLCIGGLLFITTGGPILGIICSWKIASKLSLLAAGTQKALTCRREDHRPTRNSFLFRWTGEKMRVHALKLQQSFVLLSPYKMKGEPNTFHLYSEDSYPHVQ